MKRVAIIQDMIDETCQSEIWNGIIEVAQKEHIHTITFPATTSGTSTNQDTHYQLIADSINHNQFDGIILFTAAMAEQTEWSTIKQYADSFKIPLISVAGDINSTSSITIDNKSGIVDLIVHLYHDHNKRKIVFIKGPESNEEAIDRLNAYKDGLDSVNIALDYDLIFPGNFSETAGRNAVKALIEKNIEFDAIIGTDDYTAIGAIKELRNNGIYPPDKIAVVGFDNIVEASLFIPSITTVKQPFFNMGKEALKSLIKIWNGEDIASNIVLNTSIEKRESCGCQLKKKSIIDSNFKLIKNISGFNFIKSVKPLINKEVNKRHLNNRKSKLDYRNFILESIEELWLSFSDTIYKKKNKKEYLKTLLIVISKHTEFTLITEIWEKILIQLIPYSLAQELEDKQLDIEKLIHETDIILNNYETNSAKLLQYDLAAQYGNIRSACQHIITTKESSKLYQVIRREISDIGFREAALVLFNNYSPISIDKWNNQTSYVAKIIISDGKPKFLKEEGVQFTPGQLIPEQYQDLITDTNHIYLPLHHGDDYFGYLILSYENQIEKVSYSEIQLHISSALQGSFMFDNLQALSMTDDLTGLSNRRGFMLLANQLRSRCQSTIENIRIFYFDLDNIKKINDKYGHHMGDKLIKEAASILKQAFRNNDVIGRVGSDEFVAIIEDSIANGEVIIIQRLNKLIKSVNNTSSLPLEIGISYGVSELKVTDKTSLINKIEEADRAMLYNKQEKKNILRFTAKS